MRTGSRVAIGSGSSDTGHGMSSTVGLRFANPTYDLPPALM